MTEQSNAATNDNSGGQGYNLKVTPKGDINTAPGVNGTRKIVFRGMVTLRGKERERTFVAQGKAADAVAESIKTGEQVSLRCLFSEAPSREEGKRGAEYLTVIGLPLPPKQKAA
jgi:hypothetical protein